MLSADKVRRWMADEVTKEFFAQVREDERLLVESLTQDSTELQTAKDRGILAGIRGVLQTPEDMLEQIDQGE